MAGQILHQLAVGFWETVVSQLVCLDPTERILGRKPRVDRMAEEEMQAHLIVVVLMNYIARMDARLAQN